MAPSISSAVGTLLHNGTLTINGSGFGTKSPAVPLIWEDCMHGLTIVGRGWSGYWPFTAADSGGARPDWNLDYRTVTQSVAMPHSFTTKYLCAHYGPEQHALPFDYQGGVNILVWKTLTGRVKPWSFYASWRRRTHPGWQINTATGGNPNNFKLVDYGCSGEPYAGSGHDNDSFYHSYNYPGASTDLTVGSLANAINGTGSGNTILETSEEAAYGITGNHFYGPGGAMEFQQWVQAEWVQRSDPTNGHLTWNWNCAQAWPNPAYFGAYSGLYNGLPTDRVPDASLSVPGRRTITLGGFNSDFGTNNWRYYADLYLDDTWSRVCIGDAATYTACTVREMQIPSAWSTTQIQVSLKQNTFSALAGKWLYVIDSTGATSPAFQLTGAPPAMPSSGWGVSVC